MKYGPTLFCLCVMLGLSADAQPRSSDQWALSQWQKRVWQIEDGLPHNYVTSVSQDGKGRLLIATKCGIVTFDGFQFAPYPLLKEMPVYSVLQASDGVLWAGTYRQGLYRIQNGRATKIENGTFFSLTETKDGRVWAVSDIGAGYIEKDHFRITVTGAYTGVYGQPTSQDEDGSLWLAAKSGIFHYRGNRIQAMQVRKLDGLPVTVYSVPVSHELFLGTTKKLYRLVCNRSSCVGSAVEGVQGPIVGLHQAFDQTLWIATWGHGLYRLSRINGKNKLENVDSRSGLADGFVRTLYEDNEHDMWVGTRGSGLTRFRTTILKPFGMSEGIDGNCASSAIGDGEGGVWLGTWRSGLFHWSNGKMEQQALPRDRLDILINALALDSERNLWIGSASGLLLLRHGKKEAKVLPQPTGAIRQILFARDSSLWVIDSKGDLSLYPSGDPSTSRPQSILDGEGVAYILQDASGTMWIGTRNGLWKTANARSYPVRVSQSSSPVLSLGEDRQHRLWSTYEDGSVLVRAAEGVLPFPHTGFPNKLVYKVMEDADGNFWFSTGLGVARVSGTEVASALTSPATNIDVITMGIAEGARTIECRCAEHPQGWVSPHGNMWIPTAKGFVQANPHRVGSLPSPPVSIESIQSDGRPFGTGNQIRLSAGAHNLEFHFTAVRLGASDQVNFRYRLEGVDDKWIDAGQNRTVRYMQLGPGRYRFLVAARDPMGPWGSAATASIEQEPRFYQTIWFTCAMMVLALFVMTSIYFARLRGIHNRYNAVLQERGRIAREWHDTLLTGLSASSAWQLDAAIHICTHPRLLASLTNVLAACCAIAAMRRASPSTDSAPNLLSRRIFRRRCRALCGS